MPSKPSNSNKKKALGRGLSALLPSAVRTGLDPQSTVMQVPVAQIDPNPVQPRARFDTQALEELAASIRADGVLQPVLVRPDGDRYTLIVGERRLKASRLAGLASVPAIVRKIGPDKILEVTLIENIQREDLNPIEIARALERMLVDLHLTHEELAARTGLSRTSVTNHLRLLKLSPAVQRLVLEGKLQMGHARALLSVENSLQQETLAAHAAEAGLSVRQVEQQVRQLQQAPRKRAPAPVDPNVAAAIEQLEHVLQAPVRLRLRKRGDRGRLEIAFSSQEQLAAIYDRIVGESP